MGERKREEDVIVVVTAASSVVIVIIIVDDDTAAAAAVVVVNNANAARTHRDKAFKVAPSRGADDDNRGGGNGRWRQCQRAS